MVVGIVDILFKHNSWLVTLVTSLITWYDKFREPFVGGGSIFVYLKQKYPDKKFWINDLYENLYHFWNNCKNNPEELLKQISKWKNEYSNGKELHKYLLNNIDNFDESNKVAAFFVFNRITFSGTTESGGYSNAAFKGRFTNSSIERVKQLSTILAKTKITNIDYQKVVEKPGENVFIFLDPPYYSATKSALYGKNGNFHKSFNHIRFAEVMKNCNHKWLLTYDNSEYIKELFSFANIFEWDLTYGMRNVSENSNQNGKELFISNFLDYYLISEQLNVFDTINNSTIIKYADNKPIHA